VTESSTYLDSMKANLGWCELGDRKDREGVHEHIFSKEAFLANRVEPRVNSRPYA
jgi:hypothetical protein